MPCQFLLSCAAGIPGSRCIARETILCKEGQCIYNGRPETSDAVGPLRLHHAIVTGVIMITVTRAVHACCTGRQTMYTTCQNVSGEHCPSVTETDRIFGPPQNCHMAIIMAPRQREAFSHCTVMTTLDAFAGILHVKIRLSGTMGKVSVYNPTLHSFVDLFV